MPKKKQPELYTSKDKRNKKAKSLVKKLNIKYPKFKFRAIKKEVVLRNPDFPQKSFSSGKWYYSFLIRKRKK